MNNARGLALLASIERGQLVTLRAPDGATFTGRAAGAAAERASLTSPTGKAYAAVIVAPGGRFQFATSANILKVTA